jgi:hypothetical protein
MASVLPDAPFHWEQRVVRELLPTRTHSNGVAMPFAVRDALSGEMRLQLPLTR